jgi:multidrug resistance efflux pump
MLNISENSVAGRINLSEFRSFQVISLSKANLYLKRLLLAFLVLTGVVLFLPWTQNIQTKGKVTALLPEQRPQYIQSTIAGRIEKWYVQEGEMVRTGDTIVFLSETKTDYFDPNLVGRTELQVTATEATVGTYDSKAIALQNQITSMRSERDLKKQQLLNKLQQARLKITSDSIEWSRALIDFDIARRQLERTQELYNKGWKPLTEVEQKNLKVQETNAKRIAAENKLQISQNELLNAQIELGAVESEYASKIAKAEAERFSTLSEKYNAEAKAGKLRNEFENYRRRSAFYYITAPQDGYVTKAMLQGVGETVKEGENIVSIMPAEVQLAVEMYVRPIDLPLISKGNPVNFIFDGWPAFVFSGWPDLTFGTFTGRVVAIDNEVSDNGKFRVLVGQEAGAKPWPDALRVGTGAQSIAFLNRVPVWYELWRKLNGFPPDFYENKKQDFPKMKAPVKSLK